MAKKEDYVKYVNMAKKLINKYGTELTVVLGLDATDEEKLTLAKEKFGY